MTRDTFGLLRRITLVATLLLLATSGQAHAQTIRGSATAGPAGFSGFFGTSARGFHVAGGGELLVRGVGGGIEIGVLGNQSSGLIVFSANGVAHIPARGAEASGFVTGGYTRSSGEGTFNMWNAGGGFDNWFNDRAAFRVEFRDHVREDRRGTVHYWTIRAGVAFR